MPMHASGNSITGVTVATLAPIFLEAFQRRSDSEFDGVFHQDSPARDMAFRMLCRDVRLRPDAKRCLQHPWLNNSDAQENQHGSQKLHRYLSPNALLETSRNSKFQQQILLLAARRIPPGELRQINAAFRVLDSNCNGSISTNELASGMLRLGMSNEVAQALAGVLDVDCNGQIEYSEFLAGLVEQCSPLFRDALWSIFCRYDKDCSGYLGRSDLQQMLEEVGLEVGGPACSEEEVRRLLNLMDTDRDGQLSYHEFCAYLTPLLINQSEKFYPCRQVAQEPQPFLVQQAGKHELCTFM